MMDWREGEIDGVQIRTTPQHHDDRGWLAEIFRTDELDAALMPTMAYVSVTRPGVARGPHEHVDQTDMFGFFGPGDFMLRLWDAREDSPTHGTIYTGTFGASNPGVVIIPPGVVHAYRNVSDTDAFVLNLPNRLYAGEGKAEPVDEIRHEERDDDLYSMDP